MAIIRFTTCDNVIEANFIKNDLENEDIECFLTNEISSTLLPGYSGILNAGVQIMIAEKDFDKAFEPIDKSDSENQINCPSCNSINISFGFGESKIKKYFMVVLSLFSFTPMGNLKGHYYCKDCKVEF
jgi:hypothetical protein